MPRLKPVTPHEFEMGQEFIDLCLREYGQRERLRRLGKVLANATDAQLDAMFPALYEGLRSHGVDTLELRKILDAVIDKIQNGSQAPLHLISGGSQGVVSGPVGVSQIIS